MYTVLVILQCFLLLTTQQDTYSVYHEGGQWIIRPGTGGIAVATYSIQQTVTGWDYLSIITERIQPDSIQAYAAGFIEGALTYKSIYNAWLTTNATQTMSNDVAAFVLAQDQWVRNQVKTGTSDYWTQVGLILQQFDGMVAGYNSSAPVSLQIPYLQWLYLQLGPELDDIATYVQLKLGTFDEEQRLKHHYKIGSHCSVLVKISSDGKQLFAAHDTWSDFSSMLRIYKTYSFLYNNPKTMASKVSFSSYPASITSTDDFYITNAGLVVMETTNEILNNSLYLDFISTSTVPEWIRIVVANRMSADGSDWSNTFAYHNSGTYNNQWQVVNFSKFTPGSPLQPGTLWILEQVPGFTVSQDVTAFLSKNRFWPSYNIPYFPFIYNISNYPQYYKQYGNTYSYSECARAQIFRRDAPSVETIDDMKTIMRYNEYQSDPLSLQDACRGISARCDLNVPWANNTLNSYSAFGGIDSKITSNILASKQQAWVVSGPTWDSQPPFAWTKQWNDVPHYGQADVFDFEFSITP
eukprot:TRINITY_DN172_c0_g1_i5.p1 TRINITY_DN172_c0_g1~~TRINITY_DN172_c0_g1_i5.p1  ORF type:complete len:523 (+),score=92.62 TRINITY_DN172_c0_g1_i5:74-1642(+)